jgi:amino acid adenylation domain-containing protein
LERAPRTAVRALEVLGESERQQVLFEWNATATEYAKDRCIHELFEAQAAANPERIAIEHASGEASADRLVRYGELNARANRLAQKLIELGVKREGLVALHVGRSPGMIAAMMGVLKAGGAYVPMETSWPSGRARKILAPLAVECLITEREHLAAVAELVEGVPQIRHIVVLDGEEEVGAVGDRAVWSEASWKEAPAENPGVVVRPEQVAYIIYTSGSTGVPKGVVVQHRPVINLIEWVNKTFEVGAKDKLLFVTSICFDLSVYDVFGILAAGGTISLAVESDIKDPERLSALMTTRGITFWDSAPALLQQLVPYLPAPSALAEGQPLRLVFLSGDWIPLKLPATMQGAFPRVNVVSLGGATEATIWSNYYPVTTTKPEWVSIPYGKPIQNACYYILDGELNPCPIGVAGHLYIGGECLAAGYMNDPERTGERFIADPFRRGVDPAARMYQTGDMARYYADGNIEFLGRSDFQVKIRGFRIELGEIEAGLAAVPGVREAVVLAREDAPGDKRLVAYYAGSEELTAETLRSQLAGALPEYMVPAAYVRMETFPVTANGKLDRSALPAPGSEAYGAREYEAPQGAVEEQLAGIWAELLKVEKVGRQDHFFELGGHSLLAVTLIERMRRQGLHADVRALFTTPTLAGLAAAVGAEALRAPVEVPSNLIPTHILDSGDESDLSETTI